MLSFPVAQAGTTSESIGKTCMYEAGGGADTVPPPID